MRYTLLLLLPLCLAWPTRAQHPPKREFRGAWIQTVFQDEYRRMTPDELQADLLRKLDALQACGINAILFQVRPEADAWYDSPLEPWSRFLTGTQGVAPDPFFDPTRFLIRECHRRNMEFHAWLNPFRAGTSGTTHLAADHLYHDHPEWFLLYNGQLLFDPGIPACRRHVCDVARDIVRRYDVDAIHMDDYFYPYPVAGIPFPDDESFRLHGAAFPPDQRDAWRRDNVNNLVHDLHQAIREEKPWVRFGIGPFGIYRHKQETPDGSGSDTRGLQNYKDLHADVLLWTKKGWVDYIIPQIYWEIGHEAADHLTLAHWWNTHARGNVHLYIGQDVARTMNANQLTAKMQLSRQLPRVSGNCFWPANEILRDNGGIADSLRAHYHRYPALPPAQEQISSRKPPRVTRVKTRRDTRGTTLTWEAGDTRHDEHATRYFVIYRFPRGERLDLDNPTRIAAITRHPTCYLPARAGRERYRLVITAVDRLHNESRGRVITLDR